LQHPVRSEQLAGFLPGGMAVISMPDVEAALNMANLEEEVEIPLSKAG
jgi:hypothetical protein